MNFFDTHAHYDDMKFDDDREEVIRKIYNSGVTKCVDVGCNIETSKKAISIANSHDFIYSMIGIHPSEISLSEKEIDKDILEIKNLFLSNKKIVAIGEIGLDYHYDDDPSKDLQKYAFIKQIELANELKLPISIHTRDAIDDTIAILRKYKIENGGIIHCCPFNRELVRHGLDAGLDIAFGGTSTFKSSKNAPEIVNMVPENRMLIETDCPYLAPEPVRGTRNDSSNLKYVVRKLAEFKNIDPEEVAKMTYNNACNLFKIQ